MTSYWVTGRVKDLGGVGHCIKAETSVEARKRFKKAQPNAIDVISRRRSAEHGSVSERLLEIVRSKPGIISHEAANLLCEANANVSARLANLHQRGLVTRVQTDRSGKPFAYTIAEQSE